MSAEYLNDNVGFALSAAIAELSKRPTDDPVGFIVKWLRLSAESLEDAAARKDAEAKMSELRPSVLADLETLRQSRLTAEAKRTGWLDDIDTLKYYLENIATFPHEIWSEILNELVRIIPGFSAVYISKRETVEEKSVYRNIAACEGFARLGSIEEDPAGLFTTLFPEGSPSPLFIPCVLNDSRFTPGQFTSPGSLLLIPLVLENCLSLEAVEQLKADDQAEIPTVASYIIATFTTVGGSGYTLTGAVKLAMTNIINIAVAAYRRCDENLARRQAQFLAVTQNEHFGSVRELFEAAEAKFDFAKSLVTQPEWQTLFSELFVLSPNNEKIAAAFVFTLRAATEEAVSSEPGKLSWLKLKPAVAVAGKSAETLELTGPRLGISAEHTVKNIEALLPQLGSDEPLCIQLMHAFVTGAIAQRKADVASRREALAPDQKPSEVDADFE